MKRALILGLAIFTCLAACVELSLYPDALRLKVLETYNAAGITYSSADQLSGKAVFADVSAPSKLFHLNPNTGLLDDLAIRTFHISMNLTASSLSGFPNAFQTAPANDGVRLELTPGLMGLVVATRAGSWRSIILSRSVAINETHHVDITIDGGNRVLAILDEKVVADETDPDLSYKLSDVVVGSGLSRKRPFFGRIDDAAVDIEVARLRPNADAMVADLKIFCFTVALICLYLLVGPERREMRIAGRFLPPWQPQPSFVALDRVDLDLSRNGDGDACYIPLPRGMAAELLLDRSSVPPSSLRYLANQLEILGDGSTKKRAELEDSYRWSLPDNIGARLRILGEPFASASFYRLAEYMRDLAELLER